MKDQSYEKQKAIFSLGLDIFPSENSTLSKLKHSVIMCPFQWNLPFLKKLNKTFWAGQHIAFQSFWLNWRGKFQFFYFELEFHCEIVYYHKVFQCLGWVELSLVPHSFPFPRGERCTIPLAPMTPRYVAGWAWPGIMMWFLLQQSFLRLGDSGNPSKMALRASIHLAPNPPPPVMLLY